LVSISQRGDARHARWSYPDRPTGAARAAIFCPPRIGAGQFVGCHRPRRQFGGFRFAGSAGSQRALGHGAGAERGQSTRNTGAKPATGLDGHGREFATARVVRQHGEFGGESIQRIGGRASA
jgi:hypothetical protein